MIKLEFVDAPRELVDRAVKDGWLVSFEDEEIYVTQDCLDRIRDLREGVESA